MRTIGLVTSARSDFGIYMPLIRAITRTPTLQLRIIATGMHLVREFGSTVVQIQEAGFAVADRVKSQVAGDTEESIGRSIGKGVDGFASLFARWRPDILLVLGDRFDMFPAAVAALPFRIPVAHLAGGEISEGAIDDALRHCLTKLSHLHFATTEEAVHRILQMGEEPWRVTISGALGLDNLMQVGLWSREETAHRFGFSLGKPSALVTYHPVTLEADSTGEQIAHLLSALDEINIQCIFTHPNADTGWQQIRSKIKKFCQNRPDRKLVINAGTEGYFSLMKSVSVMVGNSSSGLVEAPSFELPVVNVGTRQQGRFCPKNVVTCGNGFAEICEALKKALHPAFRAGLRGLQNPYGDGHASERIVRVLQTVELGNRLIRKKWNAVGEPVSSAWVARAEGVHHELR